MNGKNGSQKLLVKDYMRTEVVTLAAEVTFKEVLLLLVDKKTNGAVVVDDKNRVTGIISTWDLIEYLVPDYLEEDKHLAAFESADMFGQRLREIAKHPVSRFMTKKVHTVKLTDSIMRAAIMLSEFRIRQLPVVDERGILIGYLNRTDIKNAMADILKNFVLNGNGSKNGEALKKNNKPN